MSLFIRVPGSGTRFCFTRTEQMVSLDRVTMKKGGNYLDGSPYILPLDKPYFIIKLNLLNDCLRAETEGPDIAINHRDSPPELQLEVLTILRAPPFTSHVSFFDSNFTPSLTFPYTRAVELVEAEGISSSVRTAVLEFRPFQIVDNLKYKHGGSLSDGWSHSLTLHVLPIAGDFPV